MSSRSWSSRNRATDRSVGTLPTSAPYYDWIRGDATFALIEATFQWLDEHWPQDEGETVISWGDSRLANVLFRDAEPVAVLDWEAVALGPRELDLGWLIFFHDYFQRIAVRVGPRRASRLLPSRRRRSRVRRRNRTRAP